MFAIVESGGKQYKVSKGDIIEVDREGLETGETIKFDKVLLISDKKDTQIGKPFIENSIVEGKIKEHYRDKKISIIKFKRRKHYSRISGHRQNMTRIEITKIG